MLRRSIKHGNDRAIVLEKAVLEAAGISEDALFLITINPSGGLTIQSVENDQINIFRENFEKLNKKYKKLIQNLSDL